MEYIRCALSETCQPDKFDGFLDETLLDRSVLDGVCQSTSEFLKEAEAFLSEDYIVDEASNRLLKTLESSLSKFTPRPTKYLLSLSGGVDSMSLLLLLARLKVEFAAVHIRHSSRLDDTKKELEWVQYVCKRLSVPLYYHHVQVARPHATSGEDSEISRDKFERYTRDIRFAMYERAYRDFGGEEVGSSPTYVLIGHHLDDIDENRIAELGKGNFINIDGMAEDDSDGSDVKAVVVLRPLCNNIRKDEIRDFAKKFEIPHMHNSTPKWSKRGWIRDVLDQDKDWVLDELNHLGIKSKLVDERLDAAVHEWMHAEGIKRNMTFSLESKSKSLRLNCGIIDLHSLEAILDRFDIQSQLDEVMDLCMKFAPRWNERVAQFASTRPDANCPIQKIPACDVSCSVVLTKCFQKAFPILRQIVGIQRYVSRKSVSQLVDNLAKPWINWKINNLSREVVVVQPTDGVLVILNADQLEGTIASDFNGNREAMKKTVVNSISKVRIE